MSLMNASLSSLLVGQGSVVATEKPKLRQSQRKSRAGTEAETMREGCPVACSPWLTRFVSYKTQDHLVRTGTCHNMATMGWAFPR